MSQHAPAIEVNYSNTNVIKHSCGVCKHLLPKTFRGTTLCKAGKVYTNVCHDVFGE